LDEENESNRIGSIKKPSVREIKGIPPSGRGPGGHVCAAILASIPAHGSYYICCIGSYDIDSFVNAITTSKI
jgi:hypothetical protein